MNDIHRPTARPTMRMPRQSAGVDRSDAGVAARAAQGGVEAAGFWDVIKKIGSVVGGITGGL